MAFAGALAAVLGAAVWFSLRPAAAPPSADEVQRPAATPPSGAWPPPSPRVQADAPSPAGRPPWESVEYVLAKGNVLPTIAASTDAFQELCRREAEACATNTLFWSGPPTLTAFSILRTHGRLVVLGLDHSRRFPDGEHPAFPACLERALKQAHLPDEEGEDGLSTRTCAVHTLKRPQNDLRELAGRMAACLGPVTEARRVTLTWAQVVAGDQVEIRELRLTAEGDLDGYAERCMLQAAQAPAVQVGEGNRPSFTRLEYSLTLKAFGAPPSPEEARLAAPLPPLPPPTPLSVEQEALAQRRSEEASRLSKKRSWDEAVRVAAQCVADAPRYHPCYRVLGSAAAALAERDESVVELQRAADAYRRYLELAPADDEYVARVREILEQAHLPH